MNITTNQSTPFRPIELGALLALAVLVPACSGGGGGSTEVSGDVGAFSSSGRVLAIESASAATAVAAPGAADRRELHALARDSERDVCYAIDSLTNELVRIDDNGVVESVGVLNEPVSTMAYDPDADDLVGVYGSSLRLRPSNLVRIDPETANVTVVATTSSCADVAFDRAMNRLIGVLRDSSGVHTNTLIAIDVTTGATQTLFDDVGFGRSRGLAFDPVTRTLLVGQTGEPGSIQEYSLMPPLILGFTQYERKFDDITIDVDSGRQFGLSSGSELFACANDMGATQIGTATPIVTLDRRLHGFAFDPADGRFFSMDVENHEIVKFDPRAPRGSRVTPVARLELRALAARHVESIAYDPVRGRIFGMDKRFQELLSIDPVTGEALVLRVSLGVDAILALDPASGRLFAYDQAVEVLVEVDPEGASIRILDNALGVKKVEDMEWDPVTERLALVHESAGRAGEFVLTSMALSGTASPLTHARVPDRLTAFARDAHTGVYHAFGPDQPRVEMELDLARGSSFFQEVRTLDGAWAATYRAALTVPSLGLVFAIDDERLYVYDPRAGVMTTEGTLAVEFATDLVFDQVTGDLGLRKGDTITWVSPTVPSRPKGTTNAPVQTSLRMTSYASNKAYGVLDGILFDVQFGKAVSLHALTPIARADFHVTNVTYSRTANTVLAKGIDTTNGRTILVRFDATTGEWTDLGQVTVPMTATFPR